MKVLNYYEAYIVSKYGIHSTCRSYDLEALKKVLTYYKNHGFNVSIIYSYPSTDKEIDENFYSAVFTE